MKFQNAPPSSLLWEKCQTIEFVDKNVTRYPQTRMGLNKFIMMLLLELENMKQNGITITTPKRKTNTRLKKRKTFS